MPSESLSEFVLAPLPEEIKTLASKFPEFGKILKELDINKITDITKLKNVEWNILNPSDVRKIPPQIVFAGTQNNLINLNML